MTDVIGLPLALAGERLSAEGYEVDVRIIRSRKGVDGGELRVLQQSEAPDGRVRLTAARFLTEVSES